MTASISSGDVVMDASPALAWLRDLVWPDSAGFRTSIERVPGDVGTETLAWFALPSVSSPTLLAPSSKRTGRESLHQFNDAMSLFGRTRKLAVGALIGSGGGASLSRDRFVVRSGPQVEPAIGLVGSLLPDILGVSSVEVAVSIGRQLRPNLKPVLQIMSRRSCTCVREAGVESAHTCARAERGGGVESVVSGLSPVVVRASTPVRRGLE